MKSGLISSVLLVAGAISGVHAHARVNSPPIRTPGAQHLATCGQTSFNVVQNDPTGHIEEQQPVTSDACELTLCRGMLFEDQPASNIQKVTPGQSMSMSIDCTIPHGGPANVSLLDVTGGGNGKTIGSFLASFDDFCPTSGDIPANQTNLQFSLPDADTIGGACENDGDCVVQLFWATPDFSQNYYYCVDVTLDSTSTTTTASSPTSDSAATTSTSATEAATTSSSDSTISAETIAPSESNSAATTTSDSASDSAATEASTSTDSASDSTTTASTTTTESAAATTTSVASSSGCTRTVTATVTCTVTASSSMTDAAAATSTATMSDAASSVTASDAASSSSMSDSASSASSDPAASSSAGDVISAEVAQNVAVSSSGAGSASTGAANPASSTSYTGAAAGAAFPMATPTVAWGTFIIFVLLLQ